jgi:hypothetical protein
MRYLLAILILCSSGCSAAPLQVSLSPEAVSQANEVYNPLIETAFCVSSNGIHNVVTGGPFSCDMPICDRADIVFHTHAIFSESGANFLDWSVWGKYKARYGNDLYGVMAGRDIFLVYER